MATTGKIALLNWCKKVTSEYSNVTISDFSQSWRDGLAFLGILHHFYGEKVVPNFQHKKPNQNERQNLEYAFKISKQLGIEEIMVVDDILYGTRPEPLSMQTQVIQWYQFFKDKVPSDSIPDGVQVPKSTTSTASAPASTPLPKKIISFTVADTAKTSTPSTTPSVASPVAGTPSKTPTTTSTTTSSSKPTTSTTTTTTTSTTTTASKPTTVTASKPSAPTTTATTTTTTSPPSSSTSIAASTTAAVAAPGVVAYESKVKDLETQIKSLNDKITKLEQDKAQQVEKLNKDFEQEKSKLETSLRDKASESEDLTKQLKESTVKLKQWEEKMKEEGTEKQTLISELALARQQRDDLMKKSHKSESSTEVLKRERDNALKQVSELKEKIQKNDKEVASLNEKLQQQEKKSKLELDSLKKKYDTEIGKAKEGQSTLNWKRFAEQENLERLILQTCILAPVTQNQLFKEIPDPIKIILLCMKEWNALDPISQNITFAQNLIKELQYVILRDCQRTDLLLYWLRFCYLLVNSLPFVDEEFHSVARKAYDSMPNFEKNFLKSKDYIPQPEPSIYISNFNEEDETLLKQLKQKPKKEFALQFASEIVKHCIVKIHSFITDLLFENLLPLIHNAVFQPKGSDGFISSIIVVTQLANDLEEFHVSCLEQKVIHFFFLQMAQLMDASIFNSVLSNTQSNLTIEQALHVKMVISALENWFDDNKIKVLEEYTTDKGREKAATISLFPLCREYADTCIIASETLLLDSEMRNVVAPKLSDQQLTFLLLSTHSETIDIRKIPAQFIQQLPKKKSLEEEEEEEVDVEQLYFKVTVPFSEYVDPNTFELIKQETNVFYSPITEEMIVKYEFDEGLPAILEKKKSLQFLKTNKLKASATVLPKRKELPAKPVVAPTSVNSSKSGSVFKKELPTVPNASRK